MSWPTVPIAEACEIISGATPDTNEPAFWGGDICWATPKDLSDLDGAMISDTPRKLTKAGLASCSANLLPVNSVLFSSRAPIGHVAVNTVPMATNQGFKSFVPRAGKLDAKFLYYWLRAHRPQLEAMGNGATFKEVSKAVVERVRIPLPPLAEQKRIAAVLDKADDLRGKRRQALATLDTLLQSVFLDMFGDPVTNPKGWPRVRLDDLLSIRRGGSPRPIEQYLGGTINWIKIGDATLGDEVYITSCRDKIIPDGLKKTVFLKAGSLIVANSGVSLGFARILKIDGCIHDGWLSFADIPPDRIDKFFLLKAINALTIHLRQIAPNGTQPNLTTDIMKSFSFALPPLPLQQRFAAIMEKVEVKRTASARAAEGMESLFATLQSAAFVGTLFNGEMVKAAASKPARPTPRPAAV